MVATFFAKFTHSFMKGDVIMFRGFREIKTNEKVADKFEEESKKYQQIKPETDTTIEEVKNFWDGVFTGLELS